MAGDDRLRIIGEPTHVAGRQEAAVQGGVRSSTLPERAAMDAMAAASASGVSGLRSMPPTVVSIRSRRAFNARSNMAPYSRSYAARMPRGSGPSVSVCRA